LHYQIKATHTIAVPKLVCLCKNIGLFLTLSVLGDFPAAISMGIRQFWCEIQMPCTSEVLSSARRLPALR